MEQLAMGRSVRACHSMRLLDHEWCGCECEAWGSTAASCCGVVHAKHSLGVAGLTMSRIYEERQKKDNKDTQLCSWNTVNNTGRADRFSSSLLATWCEWCRECK